ncbi:hypothetical protein SBA4_3090017 [Candidatus Sulfopaludibacter sp. SbA4]|nr:hypothetical protein SBA4_3090017 [Candidatus Sulfopaludibacter sp. SbA4]
MNPRPCSIATPTESVYPERSPLRYLTEWMFDNWRDKYGHSVSTRATKGTAVLKLGGGE